MSHLAVTLRPVAWTNWREAEQKWLAAYQPLVDHAYGCFVKTGKWPSVEETQRVLDAADHDIEVVAALAEMPRFDNESRPYHPSAVIIPMRLLTNLDRARPLLSVCMAVLNYSREVYRSGSGEVTITNEDERLRVSLGGKARLLPRAGQLLNSECITPIAGGVSGGDSWQFSLRLQLVRTLPPLRRLAQFFDWQEATLAQLTSQSPGHLHFDIAGLGGSAPAARQRSSLTLEGLHPSIVEASGELFNDGHLTPAIFEAFKAIEIRVRDTTGLEQVGQQLMSTAFNQDAPLIDVSVEAGLSGRDEQLGFKFIFMGAMSGIRNPKGHERVIQNDPQRTLEYLAFASVLMRRLDDALEGAGD